MTISSAELQLQIQHRLVEELSLKERQFRDLVELLEEIVFQCDDSGSLVFVNPSWLIKLGYAVSASVGTPLVQYAADDDSRRAIERAFDLSSADGPVAAQEIALRADGGQICRFVMRVHRRDAGWVGSLFDVTERCRAEAALRQREDESRRLSLVASRTDNLVIITDARGRIEWVNDAFTDLTGYALEEVVGQSPGSILQGAGTDVAAVRRMRDALGRGEGFSVEVLNYARDGSSYWVSIDCSPVRDHSGRVTHFVAIERDISTRHAAERALRESERRYRQVVDSVREAIIRCDGDLVLRFVNPAWSLLTQRKPGAALGVNLRSIVHRDEHEVLDKAHRSALEAQTAAPVEVRLSVEGGGWRWCELTLTRGDSEDTGDLVGTIRDIQQQRETQAHMRKAKELAERLSVERTQFVANMSHEIRTPLNAVIGMGELLSETELTPEQRGFVETIASAGEGLLSLLNNVLDFAKAESGAIEYERRPYELIRPIETSVDLVASKLLEKGLSLRVSIDPALPWIVMGDEFRTQQVMTNLLSNAAKFTEAGGVTVSLKRTDEDGAPDEHGMRVCLEVADTGIGIRPEAHDRLFTEFSQADASTTRSFGGTGLGLAICKQICDRVGAHISVREGVGGVGTVFSIDAPLVICPEQQQRPLQNVRVMIDLRESPVAAAVRQTVLWAGATLSDDERADWIVGDTATVIPDGSEAQVTRIHDQILQVLTPTRLLRERMTAPGGTVSGSAQADPCGFLSVLVVEDHPTNQMLIRRMLVRFGYEVSTVSNGAEALAELDRHNYDLILMDMHMPVMDGLQCVRAIRQRQDFLQPRVIAVTAEATAAARERALRAGCDGWITKPLNPRVLGDALSDAERALAPMKPHDMSAAPKDLLFCMELESAVVTLFQQLCDDDTLPPSQVPIRMSALQSLADSGGSLLVQRAVAQAAGIDDWRPAQAMGALWRRQLSAAMRGCPLAGVGGGGG